MAGLIHRTRAPLAHAWGRRSYSVACLARSDWQPTENDGLPHGYMASPQHEVGDLIDRTRAPLAQLRGCRPMALQVQRSDFRQIALAADFDHGRDMVGIQELVPVIL